VNASGKYPSANVATSGVISRCWKDRWLSNDPLVSGGVVFTMPVLAHGGEDVASPKLVKR